MHIEIINWPRTLLTLVFGIGGLTGHAQEGMASEPADLVTATVRNASEPLPRGAIARLGFPCMGPKDDVFNVIFSRDGRLIATAGRDPGIYLFDATTRQLLHHFGNSKHNSCSIAFLPDGRTLVSADFRQVTYWETATGRETRRIPIEGRTVAVSPDGKVLAIGRGGDNVHLVHAATGKEFRRLQGGTECLAFSRDSKILATADSIIKLWDVGTGSMVGSFGNEERVKALAFCADNAWLVSGGRQSTLWDVRTCKEVRSLGTHQEYFCGMALSADGRSVACGRFDVGHTIRLWELATGKQLAQFLGNEERVCCLACSPDGRTLVVAGFHGLFRQWNIATGTEIGPAIGKNSIRHLLFLPDGKTLAALNQTGSIQLWDVAKRTAVQWQTYLEFDRISGGELRQDGKKWVWQYDSQVLSLADLVSARDIGAYVRFFGTHEQTFWSEKKFLATHQGGFGGGGALTILDVATGKEWSRLRPPKQNGPGVLTLHSTSKLLASGYCQPRGGGGGGFNQEIIGNEDRIFIWHLDSKRLLHEIPGAWLQFVSLGFTVDGKMLFARGLVVDGKFEQFAPRRIGPVRFLETATGRDRASISFVEHSPTSPMGGAWTSLVCSPNGRYLALGSEQKVCVLEVPSLRELPALGDHQGRVTSVIFSPDSKELLSASDDGSILVWDVARLEEDYLSVRKLSAQDIASDWADLEGLDSHRAWRAIQSLVRAPDQAVAFFKKQLRPLERTDPRNVQVLVEDLDSDYFIVRERALQRLESLGHTAEPALRKALASARSLEKRRRVEVLLEKLASGQPDPETLRNLRAIEVLEYVATAAARQVLKDLASGAPEARITWEAEASLRRLARYQKVATHN